MTTFAPSINNDFAKTGRFFEVLPGNNVKPGTIGEAVKFLSWGGVVLQIGDETKTFCISSVVEQRATPASLCQELDK
jgi:hypothetical protein